MKPENLRFPYSWEERKPLLQDQILFIPSYYLDHNLWIKTQKSWDFFPNSNPIYVEICSGNGEWVVQQAIMQPSINWIAVEMDFPRVRKIWSKRANQGIKNLFIVCGRAQEFLTYYVRENLFSEIYIHFPDPWPKRKQAKHRLIQSEFLFSVQCSLQNKGKLHFVTDAKSYMDASLELIKEMPSWDYEYEWPHFIINKDPVGASWFYRLWLEKERDIFYMTLINKKNTNDDLRK